MKLFKYLILGALFGILLTKGEVISWFRIQEMFRFQSIHMYGFIGSAVVTGLIGVQAIRFFRTKTLSGQTITIIPKQLHSGVLLGGLIFGFGWALTGACPGPLYAHLGSGNTTFLITLVSAAAGTFVYGLIRHKLPHGTWTWQRTKMNPENENQSSEIRKAS